MENGWWNVDDNKNIRPPRQALAEALTLSSEILKNIELELEHFIGSADQFDDMSLMVIKRK